ncbi:MAG TPA: hypothetical protein VGM64_09960 [Lacunisphaera sp.]|jgi:hypothetical protein
MSEFLQELGYSVTSYRLLAAGAFFLWFASAIKGWNPAGNTFARINRSWAYCATLLIAMFAWRWPAIFHYKPVNPDEAQFLAGALTMLARGQLWWIDPTTSGPLVVLPLTLPRLVGFPVDFASGRIVGLLLEWGTVVCGYLTLRHLHGDQKGRLLVTPLACFMIFLWFWDFVPYCSELSPLFLCALAAWLGVTAFQPDGTIFRRGRLAACGVVLGAIPFSKLQVLPLSAAIGVSLVVWILWQPVRNGKIIGRNLLWLVGGVVLGTGSLLVSVWCSGQWNEVYQSYIVHNLHYAEARGLPWSDSGYLLNYLTNFSWGFSSYHYGALLLLALGLPAIRRASWRPLVLGFSLLIAAYGAILVPGRLYPHYLLFLTLPLSLSVGLLWGYLLVGQTRRYCTVAIALFLAVGIVSQLVNRVADRNSLHRLIAPTNPRDPVDQFINHNKKPGDSLAVWGWRPEFYVETQLPQATHEAHTEAQLNNHFQRDYFRARFVADLRENRPAFFIDSVGPADFQLKEPTLQGHETFPDLRDLIDRDYSEIKISGSFHLYLRRDRADSRN